jgi:hypothetical protein
MFALPEGMFAIGVCGVVLCSCSFYVFLLVGASVADDTVRAGALGHIHSENSYDGCDRVFAPCLCLAHA